MKDTNVPVEKWQNKFLNYGSANGLGDLSMMISTVSDIREAAKEEERKSIADSIDSFPLQDSMFFDENNWEAGYKALGEFKQAIINKHQ